MTDYINKYPAYGESVYIKKINEAVEFTLKHQLLDKELWKQFVDVFRYDSDSEDRGWRCEYWGKMMRGACLTYMYTGDEKLYNTLCRSVNDLLDVSTHDGAITTYNEDSYFTGWDMWGRKYILTGLQHFYQICNDNELKSRITASMCAHADNIIKNIGDNEGQKKITETSNFWLGVNSCSILEPFVELYKITKENRYLEFAEYIIGTGGCSGGDLVAIAYENKLMPYMYPETKAYETMSFFEGIIAYYEVTGNEYYLTAAQRFLEAVKKTDITLIGCSGCTHELFDNSFIKQTEYSSGIMQETCVTVTWMRLNARLFMLTGKKEYYDNIEISGYNALYGSMNIHNLPQINLRRDGNEIMSPLPFDSYSPLYKNRRGRGVGGLKRFKNGGHYGCCACIASAGTALMPLTAVVENDNGIVISNYESSNISTSHADLLITGSYPLKLDTKILILNTHKKEFTIKLRIPPFADNFRVFLNGKQQTEAEDGYIVVSDVNVKDEITVTGDINIKTHRLNGKVAFTYGPLVLARDTAKEPEKTDIAEIDPEKILVFEKVEPENNEMIRFRADGMIFTDYASCGNNWINEDDVISVWLDR